MHEVLVNRLGGLSLPRKSVVRLTDRTDMTVDVKQQHNRSEAFEHSTDRGVSAKANYGVQSWQEAKIGGLVYTL